jgi:hypothetical protein
LGEYLKKINNGPGDFVEGNWVRGTLITPVVGRAVAIFALISLFGLPGCQDSLRIKSYVQQQVDDSLTMLDLTDLSTGTRVRPGDTVSWPDTTYMGSAPKSFRIVNKGDSTVSLVGATPVTISGGSGQAAFADGIGQPGQSTLPPGTATEFSLTFAPEDSDVHHYCTVILGSDDPENPGFSFTASGRSTKWHGRKGIASSTAGSFISPHLRVDGDMVYATYALSSSGAIAIRGSNDGAWGWSPAFGGQIASGPYPHLMALTGASAANAGLHIMYFGSSQVSYNKTLSSSWHNDILTANATAGSGEKIYGSFLLRNGVFLTWYDGSTQSLWYNFSRDPRPPEGAEEKVDTFDSPIRLTGGSTGRTGGQYHSLARDSSGNLYLAYSGEMVGEDRSITFVRAASSNLNFSSSTSYTMIQRTQDDGICIALSESAGIVNVIMAYTYGGAIYLSSADSGNLAAWTSSGSLGSNSHYGANFSLLIDEAGTLNVLHQSHGANGGIILSSSTDSGASWSHRNLDSRASLAAGTFWSHLALDVSGQTIFAAYTTSNDSPNGYSVTLMKSLDGGAT